MAAVLVVPPIVISLTGLLRLGNSLLATHSCSRLFGFILVRGFRRFLVTPLCLSAERIVLLQHLGFFEKPRGAP